MMLVYEQTRFLKLQDLLSKGRVRSLVCVPVSPQDSGFVAGWRHRFRFHGEAVKFGLLRDRSRPIRRHRLGQCGQRTPMLRRR